MQPLCSRIDVHMTNMQPLCSRIELHITNMQPLCSHLAAQITLRLLIWIIGAPVQQNWSPYHRYAAPMQPLSSSNQQFVTDMKLLCSIICSLCPFHNSN